MTALQRISAVVPWVGPHGRVERRVDAFTTDTPGLIVHERADDSDDSGWRVTHHRSGLVVGILPDPESAMAAASRLGPLADWTSSADELRAANLYGSQIYSIIQRPGGPRSTPTDRTDRNQVSA